MTRVIGIFPREQQVGALVDSLRNEGFDRQDMIISDMAKEQVKDDEDIIDIQTELEGFFEKGPYPDTLGMDGYGLVVAVEVPKLKASIVREMMEQHGARDVKLEM